MSKLQYTTVTVQTAPPEAPPVGTSLALDADGTPFIVRADGVAVTLRQYLAERALLAELESK